MPRVVNRFMAVRDQAAIVRDGRNNGASGLAQARWVVLGIGAFAVLLAIAFPGDSVERLLPLALALWELRRAQDRLQPRSGCPG